MEEANKNEYITKEYFEKRLDERLSEQTQVIIGAVDSILSKRLGEMNGRLDGLDTSINNVQTLIDGYVKAQEDFKKDFVIIKEEVRQIKEIIKEKLGLEIRAI